METFQWRPSNEEARKEAFGDTLLVAAFAFSNESYPFERSKNAALLIDELGEIAKFPLPVR